MDIDWYRTEAARQGLTLTEEDLRAIRKLVETVRGALTVWRPAHTETLDGSYRFTLEDQDALADAEPP